MKVEQVIKIEKPEFSFKLGKASKNNLLKKNCVKVESDYASDYPISCQFALIWEEEDGIWKACHSNHYNFKESLGATPEIAIRNLINLVVFDAGEKNET